MKKTTSSLPAGRIASLQGVVEGFLAQESLKGRAAATVQAHRNALRQFGKRWGEERDLREATPQDLEAYAAEVLGRVSKETAWGYLSAVRALFGYLAETGVLLVDPAARLPLPRMANRPLGRVLTREEVTRLLESPDPASPTGLRDRALLELLYSTGLRVSELRSLRVADLGEDSVTVRMGKGAKDRVVPLGRKAREWVLRYLEQGRPKDASAEELFLGERGRAFSTQNLRLVLHQLGVRAGLDGVTCHAIRRTMATDLLRAGANPKEVSAILGHSDLTSLSRYIRIAAQEVKETHARTHPREQDL